MLTFGVIKLKSIQQACCNTFVNTNQRIITSVLIKIIKMNYKKDEVCWFIKAADPFGCLSNMFQKDLKYQLKVNGVLFRSSEALYQASRFPDYPEIQEKVQKQKSPMAAKMVTKPHRRDKSREDWDVVRVDIMRWVLRVKLACNYKQMGAYLIASNNVKFKDTHKSIVEISTKKDRFWGTVDDGNGNLDGENILGELLMELRTEYFEKRELMKSVPKPNIVSFRLFGEPIEDLVF